MIRASRSGGRLGGPSGLALGLAGLVSLALLTLGSAATQSGWFGASVTNDPDTVATGALAFTHVYAGGSCTGTARATSVSCAGSIVPQTAASSTDAITNNSDVTTTQSVTSPSCAPVKLTNTKAAGDPMLPRYATSFAPTAVATVGTQSVTGSITFGATGYAAGIAPQTLGGSPRGVSLGATYSYGYGVWFNTTAASGQLFGLGSAPTNTPASGGPVTFDRTLTLSGGKLRFTATGGTVATTTSTYNNAGWHFAYVSLKSHSLSVLLGVSTTTTVTIYVDGNADGTSTNGGLLGSPLATPTGYWFLGPGVTGSLSNFMVYNGTGSPTTPPSPSYSAATELWPLDDNGFSTYPGSSLPSPMTKPCSKVDVALAFTNPAATIATMPLSTFADASVRSVAAPPPGQAQGLTITQAHDSSSYTSDIGGLHLFVPITFTYGTTPASGWTQAFTWSTDPTEVFIP